MEYEQRIDHAKDILERNNYCINHMPARYKSLQTVLDWKGLKRLLQRIFRFLYTREFFIYRGKYVFFLTTEKINNLRGKDTKSVSNRYINYLCAVGFINKQYQHLDEDGLIENTYITEITRHFKLENPDKQIINHFYFRAYETKRELDRLEERARRLIENGITPSNISRNMLIENNCGDIAEEVYFNNRKGGEQKKQRELKRLKSFIDRRLKQQGYTFKQDIYEHLGLTVSEIDRLFRIYKRELDRLYIYKPANKADREQYNIDRSMKKWIIVAASARA